MADQIFSFDDSRFQETFKRYLLEHESEVWPRCANEKAYNVARNALEETPIKEVEIIEAELAKEVSVGSWEDSQHTKRRPARNVAVGIAIASKRASKQWSYLKGTASPAYALKLRFGKGDIVDQWRRAVTKFFQSMLGGRKRSAGYMALGWIYVLQDLSSVTRQGQHYLQSHTVAKPHGKPKGHAKLATKEDLNAVIENFAHAVSEKGGGFHRIGDAALQRGLERERANMEEYLSGKMQPGIEKFNAEQRG